MARHVFIVYSRADHHYIVRLAEYLATYDVPVWFDDAVDYGEAWEHAIREHIDTCLAVVPVMTPTAERSTWVRREISRAEAKQKPIRPLLLRGDVFFTLGHLRYEDVRHGQLPSPKYVTSLRKAMSRDVRRGQVGIIVGEQRKSNYELDAGVEVFPPARGRWTS
jgi:TIR domain-containing protein